MYKFIYIHTYFIERVNGRPQINVVATDHNLPLVTKCI